MNLHARAVGTFTIWLLAQIVSTHFNYQSPILRLAFANSNARQALSGSCEEVLPKIYLLDLDPDLTNVQRQVKQRDLLNQYLERRFEWTLYFASADMNPDGSVTAKFECAVKKVMSAEILLNFRKEAALRLADLKEGKTYKVNGKLTGYRYNGFPSFLGSDANILP